MPRSKKTREHLKGFQIKRLNAKERLANIGMLARLNMAEQRLARDLGLEPYTSPEAVENFLAERYADVVQSVRVKRNRRAVNSAASTAETMDDEHP